MLLCKHSVLSSSLISYLLVFASFYCIKHVKGDDLHPRIGVVTMTKKPHSLQTWISYWVDYHKLTHIFLYFDYAPAANDYMINELNRLTPNQSKAIRLVNITTEWRNRRWKKVEVDRSVETMKRQSLAIQDAIERAREEKVDWLLNLDIDEIVFVRTGETLQEYFARFTREHDPDHNNHTFFFHNWEIVPENIHYKNCFKNGKLFRTNGEFIAYGNGKGAARVNKHLREAGVHRFSSDVRLWNSSVEFPEEEAVVLHYVCCNAEEFISKYRILGRFRTRGWEWANFHRESRDRIMDCQDIDTQGSSTPKPLLAPPSECELKAAEAMFAKRREYPGDLTLVDVPI